MQARRHAGMQAGRAGREATNGKHPSAVSFRLGGTRDLSRHPWQFVMDFVWKVLVTLLTRYQPASLLVLRLYGCWTLYIISR